MKTYTITTGKAIMTASLIFIFSFLSINLKAQKSIEISLSGYAGYTAVNFEKALGYEDEDMEDWDQLYYSFSAKGYFNSDKPINFGAEVGWQRLYYAYYVVPYGPSPVYREFNVSTTSVMALARYSKNQKFYALAGAGIHIFGDGVAPAIFIEPGYLVSIGENLRIPLSVRLNPIFGDGTPITISFGIGVSYRIR